MDVHRCACRLVAIYVFVTESRTRENIRNFQQPDGQVILFFDLSCVTVLRSRVLSCSRSVSQLARQAKYTIMVAELVPKTHGSPPSRSSRLETASKHRFHPLTATTENFGDGFPRRSGDQTHPQATNGDQPSANAHTAGVADLQRTVHLQAQLLSAQTSQAAQQSCPLNRDRWELDRPSSTTSLRRR